MYPRVEINMNKLIHNAKYILDLCHRNNIEPMFVGKVLAGDEVCINQVLDCGFKYYADSRIDNFSAISDKDVKKVLLRLPSISDAERVVLNCDISLNSELETIIALNKYAAMHNKVHQIILMFDLGDLREGIFFNENYIPIIKEILALKSIQLLGVGTNLTCYGGVVPTYDNLHILVEIKRNIKKHFDYHIDIISGGNSSSLKLLMKGLIPRKINNLRLGESIVLGRETAYGNLITNMHYDVFTVSAEIIELKTKPSIPIGTITMDSFGNVPTFVNKGKQKRGILAIGKQDVLFDNLTPIDKNVTIIGGSSDHLIVDLTNTNYRLGDSISFSVNYAGLLQVMTSPYVIKQYTN